MVRWIVLTLAGLGLLLVVPRDLVGPRIVAVIGGIPATLDNCVGLAVMAAAWVWFLARLYDLRGPWCADAACRLVVATTVLAAVASVAAAVWAGPELFAFAAGTAWLLQVALAFRIDWVRGHRARVLTPGGVAGVRP